MGVIAEPRYAVTVCVAGVIDCARTAILIVAVADCVPLEAVTVYVVAADAAVGVPVTCPVCALKTKPAGSAGETV